MGQRALGHWDSEEKKNGFGKRRRVPKNRNFLMEFYEDERSDSDRAHRDVISFRRNRQRRLRAKSAELFDKSN